VYEENSVSVVFLILIWFDVKIQFFTNDLLINIENFFRSFFEMTGSIIGFGNPQVGIGSINQWLIAIRDRYEHFEDLSKKTNWNLDFFLWSVCFDLGGDNGNIDSLGTNQMTVRDHRNVGV
jgi:hypothetical protein